MIWQKHGNIFSPDTPGYWAHTHAQVPVLDTSVEGRWRVFYAARDAQNRSRISWFDVMPGKPDHILHVHNQPLFELGAPGTFDDCGQMPTWLVRHGDITYLYYIGWNVRNTVPFHNSIGLAISHDGGNTFQRMFDGPILDRTNLEPHFCGTACVLKNPDGWDMWYLSCTGWHAYGGKMEPRYHIKHARSTDGIIWQRNGEVAIDYTDAQEGGIAQASVLPLPNGRHMWYSYRKWQDYRQHTESAYRIGYARFDGRLWQRHDQSSLSLGTSTEGWDAQMVCYPHVIQHQQQLFMFYNGNGFGASGIGYATCALDDFLAASQAQQ